MLATSRYTDCASLAFLPTIPSPLSPRSANIHGRRALMSEKQPSQQQKTEIGNSPHQPFAKRAIKKVPSPRQDELKERRRGIFLKKVQEGRQDKRFEARGEDIMRLDFMQKQRAWEAERMREAPQIPSDLAEIEEDEELYDLPSSSTQVPMSMPGSQLPDFSQQEVDVVAKTEDEELEALLSYMETDDKGDQSKSQAISDDLWSDDDDYDALFSEFMDHSGGQQHGEASSHDPDPQLEDSMDLS